MKYILENDEIFFMCVLLGANSIIGITNPIEGFDKEKVVGKWDEVYNSLLNKGIVFVDDANGLSMNDEYAKIAAGLTFSDRVFICQNEEGSDSGYIYVKGEIYLFVKGKEHKEIEIFERDKFITFLHKKFLLSNSNTNLQFIISSEIINEAIHLIKNKRKSEAVELLNTDNIGLLNTNNIELDNMKLDNVELDNLEKFIDVLSGENLDTRVFSAYKTNVETPYEVLYKTYLTSEGTWIIKLQGQEYVSIYKKDADKALSEILNF